MLKDTQRMLETAKTHEAQLAIFELIVRQLAPHGVLSPPFTRFGRAQAHPIRGWWLCKHTARHAMCKCMRTCMHARAALSR